MCHSFLSDARFYQRLFQIDEAIAAAVQAGGCSCGGVLHSACYPRKPRGLRSFLDESYETRLSFCCAMDGCRRRSTPPSVRFLGRKVYLGTLVVLLTALQHGLTNKRRRRLIERLDIPPQTLARWQHWWREVFPASRCWRGEQGHFLPPIPAAQLPGALLSRMTGETLALRLCQVLWLVSPTTTRWTGSLHTLRDPQTM